MSEEVFDLSKCISKDIYIHAIIVHEDGDLKRTVSSLNDCRVIDVFTINFNADELAYMSSLDHYYTTLAKHYYNDQNTKHEINRKVKATDSHFVLVTDSKQEFKDLLEKIKSVFAKHKFVAVGSEKEGEPFVINTSAYLALQGFGTQHIMEKVKIQAANENHPEWVLTWDKFNELYESP